MSVYKFFLLLLAIALFAINVAAEEEVQEHSELEKSLIESIKALRSYSFIDWVQTIGGLLFIMYIPLLIGLIWFDTQTMIKIIATNSGLIFGMWIIDSSQNGI